MGEKVNWPHMTTCPSFSDESTQAHIPKAGVGEKEKRQERGRMYTHELHLPMPSMLCQAPPRYFAVIAASEAIEDPSSN